MPATTAAYHAHPGPQTKSMWKSKLPPLPEPQKLVIETKLVIVLRSVSAAPGRALIT